MSIESGQILCQKVTNDMRNSFLLVLILVLSVSLFRCTNGGNETSPEIPQQTDESDEAAVASLVEVFRGGWFQVHGRIE